MSKFPEKLLKLRKGHNLSQDFLAKKLGIDIFDYMAIENGRIPADKLTIDRIANIYEITSEELTNDDEEARILNLGNKFKEEKRRYRFKEFYINLKHGKYNGVLFICGVALIFFVIVASALPKSYNITVSFVPSYSNTLSANRDTVVFLGESIEVSGKDAVDFKNESIVKVVSGINYFAALTEDGRVITSGFNVNYKKDIDKIKNAVDIQSGKSHILVLLNNGKVKCIGNNDYGQCEVSKWRKVSKIFADGYGSLAISEDGLLYTGNVPYASKLSEMNFKQIEFNEDVLFVLFDNGSAELYGSDEFSLDEFNDLAEIALDNDFIAGLKKDGSVIIDIDNYLLLEKTKHFENIKTIDAGDSYLVVSDGLNVYGIGENNYNQFNELEIELKPLESIKNLNIEKDNDDVVITFDKVLNATAYTLTVNEINIDVKVEDNKIVLPLSLFEEDKKYIMMLTAKDIYGLYLDSETVHVVFSYTETDEKDNKDDNSKENEEIILEIPFVVADFINEPKDSFISFLEAYDYDISKIKSEGISSCGKNNAIVEIEGISAGEEITAAELLEREISYKYCEVGVN